MTIRMGTRNGRGFYETEMPEGMEAMIMKEVKNQLGEILTQIRKIEIGFVLTLDELDRV